MRNEGECEYNTSSFACFANFSYCPSKVPLWPHSQVMLIHWRRALSASCIYCYSENSLLSAGSSWLCLSGGWGRACGQRSNWPDLAGVAQAVTPPLTKRCIHCTQPPSHPLYSLVPRLSSFSSLETRLSIALTILDYHISHMYLFIRFHEGHSQFNIHSPRQLG